MSWFGISKGTTYNLGHAGYVEPQASLKKQRESHLLLSSKRKLRWGLVQRKVHWRRIRVCLVSAVLLEHRGIFLLFLKIGDNIPRWKMFSLVKLILRWLCRQHYLVHVWELPLQGFLASFEMKFPLFIFTAAFAFTNLTSL